MSMLNSIVAPVGNWPRCLGKQEAGDNPLRAKQAKATTRGLAHKHSTDTTFCVIHNESGVKQRQLQLGSWAQNQPLDDS